MSATITAYNEAIAIVNIPVDFAHRYTTKLYWTIDRIQSENTEFFNVTSNRIEIAIFAPVDLVSNEWDTVSDPDVQVNTGWRVFEISSGDGGEGSYDSPHIRQVAQPLAEAKISILYHPSYFTDFLLVKETDFVRASAIFATHGWHVSSTASTPRRRSQLLSPLTPHRKSPTPPPAAPEISVLSTPLVCVGLNKAAESRSGERIRKFIVWPERTIQRLEELETCPYSGSETSDERPFISYTRTLDGASLLTEHRVLREMFKDGEESVELQSGGELSWDVGSVDDEDDDVDDFDEERKARSPAESDTGDYFSHHFDVQTSGRSSPIDPEPPIYDTWPRMPRPTSLPAKLGPIIPIKWSSKPVYQRSLSGGAALTPPLTGRQSKKKWMRCLQLDLRGVDDHGAYHLDKSGLVTRFSDLLQSGNIKMLYSSTYHTANILVDYSDVKRAKQLLERRRRSEEWGS